MIEIKEITRYDHWVEIREAWNRLVSQSGNNNFFSTFEWLSTWWRHFGKERELFILVLTEGDQLVGLAPWMLSPAGRGVFSYKKIEFIGAGLSDWADLILIKEKEPDLLLNLIAEHLRRRSGAWDVATFSEMKGGKFSGLFEEALTRKKIICVGEPDSVCPFTPLEGTWEAFYNARTTAKTRGYRRRDLKRLEGEGKLEFRVLHDISGEPALVEDIFKLGLEVFPDLFGNREKVAFLREILTVLSRAGRLKISVLEHDKQVICFLLGFFYEGQYLGYLRGYDRRYAQGSPGEAALQMTLQHCFESGVSQFHFLRGPEAYKSKWASEFQQNRRIELFQGFKGNVVYYYRRIRASRKD